MAEAEPVLEGGCLCGKVRWRARGQPYRVGLCHCMTCRKSGGSVFNAFAIFPAGKVETSGASRAAATSEHGRRHFCPDCGAPVFSRDEGSDEIEIPLGALDEPDRLQPTYELWIGRRESWLSAVAGTIQYPHNRQGRGRREP